MNKELAQNLLKEISDNFTWSLNLLEQLVNTNSFTKNTDGVNKVQDIIEAELKSFGLETTRVKNSNFGDHLFAKNDHMSNTPILLVGHADTVHPLNESFAILSLNGDIATGPGVLDMKGGLVILLSSLKSLYNLGLLSTIPVTVLITSDEEAASVTSEKIIRDFAKESGKSLVFEWARGDSEIILKRKGIAVYRLEAAGKSAHSGNAHEEGYNAIALLSKAIIEIQSYTDYASGLTLNVGLIEGGTSVSTVPASASATFDIRVTSNSQYQEIKKRLKSLGEKLSDEIGKLNFTEISYRPPMEETNLSREMANLFKVIADENYLRFGIFPEIIGGGSDANFISAENTPCIDGLGPLGAGAHTLEEHIFISSLIPRITLVSNWLLRNSL